METERRKEARRKGPIRLGQRRKENIDSKARVQRGAERRKADRRSGMERRQAANSGNTGLRGAA